jgi:hypothetical protein
VQIHHPVQKSGKMASGANGGVSNTLNIPFKPTFSKIKREQ